MLKQRELERELAGFPTPRLVESAHVEHAGEEGQLYKSNNKGKEKAEE